MQGMYVQKCNMTNNSQKLKTTQKSSTVEQGDQLLRHIYTMNYTMRNAAIYLAMRIIAICKSMDEFHKHNIK